MPDQPSMPVRIAQRWRLFVSSVVALASVAVISLVVLVGHQRDVDRAARDAVRESCLLRLHMQRVFSLMQDVETGARGFVITGRSEFLDPYDRAKSVLPEEMAEVRTGAAAQQELAYAARLDGLIRSELEINGEIVALRRSGAAADAKLLVRAGQGKAAMDQIRTVLAQWQSHEREALEDKLAVAAAADEQLSIGLAWLGVWVLLIVTLTAWVAVALAKSRDEAAAANEAKSAFLAMMSHELRTPLNGVLGMAHALATTSLDPRQLSYVKVIEGSGKSLLLLLNDILDLSKIEAGRLDIEAAPFCLTELLNSMATLWSVPAAEKGLQLAVQIDPGVPAWISGDALRLRQILTNLLSNAIKFTDRGEVRLSVAYSADRRLRFEVADTGPGIAAAVQAKLFKDFSQADVSIGRRFGGTGLGLSISRRLCRMMGGDLEVQSVEGSGAVLRGSVLVDVAEAPPEANEPRDEIGVRPLRILAVDDNPNNRAVIEALLHALGLSAYLACDGAEALEVLRASPMDLVLMDVNMPVMNGTEALAAIRSGKAGDRRVRVVALTADAMTGDRERYLAQGFDDHLGKPIQPALLLEVIAEAAEGIAHSPPDETLSVTGAA